MFFYRMEFVTPAQPWMIDLLIGSSHLNLSRGLAWLHLVASRARACRESWGVKFSSHIKGELLHRNIKLNLFIIFFTDKC